MVKSSGICCKILQSALPDLYDVEFVFKVDNSHKTLKAHKLILSAWSEVFKELFYGENSLKESKIIEVLDTDYDCFSKMIDYIYQEPLNLAKCSMEKVLKLYIVLKRYKVKDGETFIIEHLKTVQVPVRNVEVELLSFCSLIQKTADQPLKTAFETCLGNHGNTIMNHHALKKLDSETVFFIYAAIFDFPFYKKRPETCVEILENYAETIENLEKMKSNMQPAIEKIDWNCAKIRTILACNILNDNEKVSKLFVNASDHCFTQRGNGQTQVFFGTTATYQNPNSTESNNFLKDCQSNLRELFQDAKTKDCEFKFSTGESLKAHKLVLSMSSAVFDKMFYGPMKEQGPIKIIDFDKNVFETFIQMIYFQTEEKLSTETPEFLSHLYALLQKYDFKVGLKFLQPFLLERKKDIFLYLTLAEHFLDTALEDACLEVLRQNPHVATESEFFLTASPETINKVFKQENMYFESDTKLHGALNRYVEANLLNFPKINVKIQDLIQKINFSNISLKDLLNSKLLSDKVKLDKFARLKGFEIRNFLFPFKDDYFQSIFGRQY